MKFVLIFLMLILVGCGVNGNDNSNIIMGHNKEEIEYCFKCHKKETVLASCALSLRAIYTKEVVMNKNIEHKEPKMK